MFSINLIAFQLIWNILQLKNGCFFRAPKKPPPKHWFYIGSIHLQTGYWLLEVWDDMRKKYFAKSFRVKLNASDQEEVVCPRKFHSSVALQSPFQTITTPKVVIYHPPHFSLSKRTGQNERLFVVIETPSGPFLHCNQCRERKNIQHQTDYPYCSNQVYILCRSF